MFDASEDGDEVGFERVDCLFGFVAPVHVGRHRLEFTLSDFGDVVEEFGTDFVVHELHVNCKSAPLEAVHEAIVCWDSAFDLKGSTRMTFAASWNATMIYWLPLCARMGNRPMSSV